MLGDLLGVLGYDVTTAGNADEAMTAVANFQPDVILLDWHMPDFGQFEGLDYFRPNHAGLPVQLQRIVAAARDQRRG